MKNYGKGTLLGPAVYEAQTLVVAEGGQALDTEHKLRKLAIGREPRVNLTMGRSTVKGRSDCVSQGMYNKPGRILQTLQTTILLDWEGFYDIEVKNCLNVFKKHLHK